MRAPVTMSPEMQMVRGATRGCTARARRADYACRVCNGSAQYMCGDSTFAPPKHGAMMQVHRRDGFGLAGAELHGVVGSAWIM